MRRTIPVLLNRDEVRQLREAGELEIRRALPAAAAEDLAGKLYGRPGDHLWGRESFACRRDGERLKIRYTADGEAGEPRFVPLDQVEPKYATERYFSRPAKHMPRWACRFVLEVLETRTVPGARRLVVVRARLDDAE